MLVYMDFVYRRIGALVCVFLFDCLYMCVCLFDCVVYVCACFYSIACMCVRVFICVRACVGMLPCIGIDKQIILTIIDYFVIAMIPMIKMFIEAFVVSLPLISIAVVLFLFSVVSIIIISSQCCQYPFHHHCHYHY